MSIRNEDWELLNGYVDRELPLAEQEILEARLMEEPLLREELSRLQEIKRHLSGQKSKAANDTVSSGTPYGWRRGAAAAAILLALFGATAGWYALQPEKVTLAEGLHQIYSEKSYLLETEPRTLQVSSPVTGDFEIPDLSASNLRLAEAKLEQTKIGEILSAHYRGTRGCRLTFVSKSKTTDQPEQVHATSIVFDKHSRLLKARWQIGTQSVTVLATGMDEDRFATISRYLQNELRLQEKRKQEELRIAMISAYQKARPCA
ncbi:hypothetical protein [Sneathiella limimaris]|uniref:hypothetical protein n=1 Tax=Sneathiella limimaris TaxID=1964213 RepID=UPI00146CC763|nr:hypothetical protein [Sneathiella limimaris]